MTKPEAQTAHLATFPSFGRVETLPPKRTNIQIERSASRPRLAAAANGQGRSNLFGADFAIEHAASRGRLALRRQCHNALPSFGIQISDFIRHSSLSARFSCQSSIQELRFDGSFIMDLSNDEIRRYSRHLILPEVGLAGQKKIRSTSVLCIGAGGLGSPIAMYLAAAGIGKLGLVDFDTVDYSNLQRQIIHGTGDVGRPKGESAKETIQNINPNVEVVLHNVRLSSENAMEILQQYDIVVDGTDNFPTRYLTNDACVLLKKPNIYGSIFRFEGQASVFAPHLGGPCYRCLYPEPPP